MARIVMKFGGTSVADLDRIRNVAKHVKTEVDKGNQVAAVVSAMAGVTNQLIDYVHDAAPLADLREYDAVVSSGEQVTAGLLAVVLQDMGIAARSWHGWQISNSHQYVTWLREDRTDRDDRDRAATDGRRGRHHRRIPGSDRSEPDLDFGKRRIGYDRCCPGRRLGRGTL